MLSLWKRIPPSGITLTHAPSLTPAEVALVLNGLGPVCSSSSAEDQEDGGRAAQVGQRAHTSTSI
jgi:hypothetical protein